MKQLTKLEILDQIKSLPVLKLETSLEKAVVWSESNPESKPHYLIQESNHVIVK